MAAEFRIDGDGWLWAYSRSESETSGDLSLRVARYIVSGRKARTTEGADVRREVLWIDEDGRKHRWLMPITTQDAKLIKHLESNGANIERGPQARGALVEYLRYHTSLDPRDKILLAHKVGWQGDTFVFPDKSIGPGRSEFVVYEGPPSRIQQRGSLAQWQGSVVRLCRGNSLGLFVLVLPFAAVFLRSLGDILEPGGFHLQGLSGRGKTTWLHVASSCVGGAPETQNGFLESWNTTAAGFEDLALAHNDLLLPLDEMGIARCGKDLHDILYMVTQGQTRSRKNERKETFRNLVLSTGEHTPEEHLRRLGRKIERGQLSRLICLNATDYEFGAFEDLHDIAIGEPDIFVRSKAFAEALKKASFENFGAPFRRFVQWYVEHPEANEIVRRRMEEFARLYVPTDAHQDTHRFTNRFAAVAAAGELDGLREVTGLPEGEVWEAARKVFQKWYADYGRLREEGQDPIELRAGVVCIAEHLVIHGGEYSRLPTANDGSFHFLVPLQIMRWTILREYGIPTRNLILRRMRDQDWLKCNPGELTWKPRLGKGAAGTADRFYAVSSKVLAARESRDNRDEHYQITAPGDS